MAYVDDDRVTQAALRDLKNTRFLNAVKAVLELFSPRELKGKRAGITEIINQTNSNEYKDIDIWFGLGRWDHSFLAHTADQRKVSNSYYWWTNYCAGPVFINTSGNIHGDTQIWSASSHPDAEKPNVVSKHVYQPGTEYAETAFGMQAKNPSTYSALLLYGNPRRDRDLKLPPEPIIPSPQ